MSHTVIVTGCNGAIGRSLCKAFRAEGYWVIGVDLDSSSSEANEYFEIDLNELPNDATSNLKQLAKSVAERQPERLCLINNAAVQITGSFDQLTDDHWKRSMQVNVLAPVSLIRNFSQELAGGCVVNIGSIHAGATKVGFSAYATSKSAMRGMTKAVAREVGNRFRVNCIEPAAIDTPMLRAGFADKTNKLNDLARYHPTNNIGTPDQVASLALVLCRSDLPFINGAIIALDGGISSVLSDPDVS